MPLPPYLISSASSHAHYALLVKLDAAESAHAADAAVLAEVERCRSVLAGKPSSSKTAETLIILLTCATTTTAPLDLDFALVPALQLAEGGKHTRDRRTGYRYLIERLPRGHELGLMLINTVRKDLASARPAHVLMALHAITGLPGEELAPAVAPMLREKRLLEHELPAIRQRSIQALESLNAPLSLKELARRIRREDDPSVLSSVVKSFADTLNSGTRETMPDKRRRQFDTLFAATARNLDPSPLLLQLTRALVAVVKALPEDDDDLKAHVVQQARSLADEIVLEVTTSSSPWSQACLLEVCSLVAILRAADSKVTAEPLMEHLRRLLLGPKGKAKEKDGHKSSTHESPNTRVLVLKCFAALPPELWQHGLEEVHMGALMAGIDSADPTTRRETLRLLARVDANLPKLTLESHLSSLSSAEEKEELAQRALEAADIACEGEPTKERGEHLASGLARISAALPSSVWMKGVHFAISTLSCTPALRAPFIDGIADALLSPPSSSSSPSQTSDPFTASPTPNSAPASGSNPTLAVILATLATEYDRQSSDVVPALLRALPESEPSVQELIVLSLVPLHGGARAIDVLKKVGEGAIPHIGRRCAQVALVLERGLGWDVVGRAKSRALNDILDALLAVHAEAVRPPLEERDSTPTASMSMSRTSASALRYNYDRPGSPLNRASELAMGRSMLSEHEEDVAMDEIARDTGRVRLA